MFVASRNDFSFDQSRQINSQWLYVDGCMDSAETSTQSILYVHRAECQQYRRRRRSSLVHLAAGLDQHTHTQKTAIQRTSIQNKSTWYLFWFSFSSFDFAYFCLASAHFVIVCVCRSFIVSGATFFSRSARAVYLAHVFFLCCAVPRPSFAFSLLIILSLCCCLCVWCVLLLCLRLFVLI